MDRQASILVVDDDVELLKAVTKVLESEGYIVVSHPNAMMALEDVQANKRRFDLVITDLSMPDMRGTVFMNILKTAFPDMPVIIMTAFGDWGQYMDAMRQGAFEFVTKPINKADLLDIVRRALRAHPAAI